MTMSNNDNGAVASNAELGATQTARLDWSLYVTCPKCDESNDLNSGDHDCENQIARRIFTNEWDKLKDWEVTCEHCGHEFKLAGVEY
jgi:phage terminase large subunit GpA-like protein